MAQTPSNMLALGTQAPDFMLKDTISGKFHSYNDLKGEKGTLVMFICNHCPFVHHVIAEISKIAIDYRFSKIGMIAISSNDAVKYPSDGPEKMAEFAAKMDFEFPYLYDDSQQTAKAYDAACTPDFFLFDADNKLFYRGQLDDSRPGNDIPVTGENLRHAIDAMLNNEDVPENQKPSIGCNIKWKAD